MKTLYLDCGMGAAGDMLTAALLELLSEQDSFIDQLNALNIPGVEVRSEPDVKCGIRGTRVVVTVHGEEESAHVHGHDTEHAHHHTGIHELEHLIQHLKLPAKVRADILAVYSLLATAESHVHGVPVTDIHFHEVGTMDALADITAVCMLMDRLAPKQVVVSPVHVGSGQVHCAHGILPVPAPATAHILREVPIYGGGIQGELCTPTGAALLRHFASSFGAIPVMKLEAIGYGMGKKDFPAANCVRALLGETETASGQVYELSCNVDDMSAEEIGFSMERLFEAGAVEVYTIPAGMKKSRPGVVIQAICREADRESVVSAIFKHTSTIGVRETACRRYILDRSIKTLDTPYGEVRRKDSGGYGVERSKYEYEDIARIARENRLSLREAAKLIDN